MKAEIVVQSHLNDADIELAFNVEQAKHRIQFVKFIVWKLNGNLQQQIDADEMYSEFVEKYI